ncbi:anthranilate synthase component I family protein [Gottfriedia luciferensis]|uniref:anthranilate synthase component I family protein n=1 Tax=Gottfriedia luciferensis TaxID=178774 RepID=UPI001F375B89|nr:anthranilate synthase component I family protein [Gottfriedia luciferensis]
MNYEIFSKVINYTTPFFRHFVQEAKEKKNAVLLESGRDGRYSIIASNPVAKVYGKNNTLTIEDYSGTSEIKGNPIDLAKNYLSKYTVEKKKDLPPFQGGAIGYFTYDCNHYIEDLPSIAEDVYNIPELYLLIFHEIVIFDHQENQIYFIVIEEPQNEQKALKQIEALEEFFKNEVEKIDLANITSSEEIEKTIYMSEQKFTDAVGKVKEYISAGDVFQVNLSVLQSETLVTDPLFIYEQLREINPSPYMSYIDFDEFQIVSCSPELLVAKRDQDVWTRPIAGTRSRGKTIKEEQRLMDELRSNEKEQAEHIMLVDLERNDLGKVCEYGTVEVDELLVIEKYSHVMHLVSNVRGELQKDRDAFDLLKAVFPGGTITGAPKIRTMEIIEELEPTKRGIYTGSVGWISYTGDMELNITIRTMITKDQQAFVQAGAGIVIDSNPNHEYLESLKKAQALWTAKKVSEEKAKLGGYEK